MTITLLAPAETNLVGVSYKASHLAFQWNNSEGPVGLGAVFVVQIAIDINFSNIIKTITTHGESDELTPFGVYLDSDLAPETTYFWRVGTQAVVPNPVPSDFSSFSCFVTTLENPSIISLEGNQAIAGNKAKVTWSPVTNPQVTHVRVNYSEFQNDTNPNTIDFGATPNSNWVTGLIAGHTYYVNTQAKGTINFNYDTVLSNSQLGLVLTSDNTEIADSTNNLVIATI